MAEPCPQSSFRSWWRLGLAAEAAGLLAGAIEVTITHLGDRHQFGRPLSSLQVIRHRMAELAIMADGARLLCYEAAWLGAWSLPAATVAVYVERPPRQAVR